MIRSESSSKSDYFCNSVEIKADCLIKNYSIFFLIEIKRSRSCNNVMKLILVSMLLTHLLCEQIKSISIKIAGNQHFGNKLFIRFFVLF